MKKYLGLTVLFLAAFSAMTAQATVITQGWYRGGEADANATAGVATAWTQPAVDSSVNEKNLANVSLSWSADVAPSAQTPLGASSLSYAFNGAGTMAFSEADVGPALTTDNVGVEVWVKAGVADTSSIYDSVVVHNGSMTAVKGFGILQLGTNYVGHVAGKGYVGSVPVSMTDWTHLALVETDGTWRLYANGVQSGDAQPFGMNSAATGNYSMIGANINVPGGQEYFTGNIDEVRYFTFSSGGFQVSDLNYPVPEPSTLGIMATGLFGLLAYAWRKRK